VNNAEKRAREFLAKGTVERGPLFEQAVKELTRHTEKRVRPHPKTQNDGKARK